MTLDSSLHADRLKDLRRICREHGLDGYMVPMTDAFQNEYVAPHEKRIKFLTGFTGTAGYVIVLETCAAFFTDSRYTLQAEDQLPEGLYDLFDAVNKKPSEWLLEHLRPSMKIGFDPRLHTSKQIERLEMIAIKASASLEALEENLIDLLWEGKPEEKKEPYFLHDVSFAGKSAAAKRVELAASLKEKNVQAALLTNPASVAWLLNVRGQDVPYTPLPCSMAIIRADGTVEWFADPQKVPSGFDLELGKDVIRYRPDELGAALKRLGDAGSRVLADPEETPYSIYKKLVDAGALIHPGQDPCALPRACKNATEIDGARAAHRRDGAALCKLLAWLDQSAIIGKTTEIDVEAKLASFREEGTNYKGPSFATIAASGPNGAIVHYRAHQDTARCLDKDSFLLLDSGGQYLDGTTDVTRTICLGEPTAEMRTCYTRVLKGHMALARAVFPEGSTGADIDVLARQFLWAVGLDYGHGTGHGVGSYLCVHEGPHSISKRSSTPLQAGMVTSNEPGYYKARHFGIRLENLQYVVERHDLGSLDHKMLGFEPLTLAPFDRRAIDTTLLCADEIDWLNTYHARVRTTISPLLDGSAAEWLAQATQPL